MHKIRKISDTVSPVREVQGNQRPPINDRICSQKTHKSMYEMSELGEIFDMVRETNSSRGIFDFETYLWILQEVKDTIPLAGK